jgi:hypothetical protein
MRHTKIFRIAIAAAVAALAIAAIPALAGAKDHGRNDGGHDDNGHHGHHHFRHIHRFGGEATGTISAFDMATGKLTITASNGDAVTGLVTSATEIKCEGVDNSARIARRDNSGSSNSGPGRGGESEPGDDNGGLGEPEPGDDNGGRGEEEPGDDHGDHGVENGEGASTCTTASLVPGAVVQEADLVVRQGSSTFDEIELAHTS